jgi:hypothetical protein
VKLVDTEETVLIVTGSDLPAEMNDRHVAYALKSEIDRLGENRGFRGAVVVSDRWYVENRIFHICATVVVGGPGVNLVTASLVESLPTVVRRDERVFVQGDWDGEVKRVLCWGMDRRTTAEAVAAFIEEGHLADFLNHAWRTGAGRRADLV